LSREQRLQDQAVREFHEGEKHRWVVCLAASRIVGLRDGSTLELAGSIGVDASQVENYARAGLAYRALRRYGGERVHKLRRRLTISHWTALADAWHKYEFPPEAGLDLMQEVAEQDNIIPVVQFRKLLAGLNGDGGEPEWVAHLAAAVKAARKLTHDYGVPGGIYQAAREFLKQTDTVPQAELDRGQ